MFALRNPNPRLSDAELAQLWLSDTERAELGYSAPKSSRGKSTRKRTDPSNVSYKQGKVIGLSVGGRNAYCPQYHGTRVSHALALTEMGLDRRRASAVIDAMIEAGVLRHHAGIETTPAQKRKAQTILYEVGGVQCKVKNNPRRRSSRRRRRF